MAIKNYRTRVNVANTLADIQKILSKGGCSSISTDYENGKPTAIRFSIKFHNNDLWFRLPNNPQGVLASLKRDRVSANLDRAGEVGWRIVKDWLDAQMALIDAGQAKTAEVFLPYAVQPSGQTLFEHFENQQKQLGSGATTVSPTQT